MMSVTATEAVNAADGVTTTRVREVSGALYDLVRQAERHRVGLAHELGLGTTDVAALWEIGRHPGLRPGDLSRTLGVGVAGTSSVVDKLVRSGFAKREPDPSDRRSLNLVLTPAGRHARGWVEEELDRIVLGALGARPDLDVSALSALAAGFGAAGG